MEATWKMVKRAVENGVCFVMEMIVEDYYGHTSFLQGIMFSGSSDKAHGGAHIVCEHWWRSPNKSPNLALSLTYMDHYI